MKDESADYESMAEWLKALGHPVRLCIAHGLLQHGACSVSYMQQCLSIPQSSLSTHLQKLRAAGIVACSRHGLEVTYRIEDDRVGNLLAELFGQHSSFGTSSRRRELESRWGRES